MQIYWKVGQKTLAEKCQICRWSLFSNWNWNWANVTKLKWASSQCVFKFCSSNKTKLYVLMQIVCIKGCAVFVQPQPRQQFLSHAAELHYSPLFFLCCSDSSPDEVNLRIWVINQGTLVCPLDNNSYSAIICWIRLVTCTSGSHKSAAPCDSRDTSRETSAARKLLTCHCFLFPRGRARRS